MLVDYDHYPRLLLTQEGTATTKDELAVKEFHWLYENGVYYAGKNSVKYCPGQVKLSSAVRSMETSLRRRNLTLMPIRTLRR